MAEAQELRRFVEAYPIIDSHAHNMVKGPMATSYDDYPLEIITTEGEDFSPAPESKKSISYLTAVKQLAKLHGCAPDFEVIKIARNKAIEDDYPAFVRKCLQGTQMLLVDNSDASEEIHYYEWYDKFTPGQSGSVAHVEALTETVIQTLVDEMAEEKSESKPMSEYWPKFKEALQESVKFLLSDPDIKALRSVANYRTGLNIDRYATDEVITCFETYCQGLLLPDATNYLCSKPLNDYVIYSILDMLQEFQSGDGAKSIPLQINTGAGAPDAELLYSSPAHLQTLIDEYDKVDFVFLHASRPFLLEAAHMASVYSNVYLTIGEVFPMVSRDGQISMIRECLETTPTNKILWASGSIYHPESYWLASQQLRHALATVLEEYIEKGGHTLSQAKRIAKDIMFNNANTLYSLDQQAKYTPGDKIPPSATTAPQQQGLFTLPVRSSKSTLGPDDKSIDATRKFIDEHPSVRFVWIQWVDYKATVQARMIPITELTKLFTGKKLIVPPTSKSVLQDGLLAVSRSICLYPDVNTLAVNSSWENDTTAPLNAVVMAFLKTGEGKRHPDCPRAMLQDIVERSKKDFDVSYLIRFELQVTLLEEPQDTKDKETPFNLWLRDHAWSNIMSDTPAALSFVQEVLAEFSHTGIEIEQFYTGASPSQFVFHLQPSTPLEAADSLIKTRQIISRVAANNKRIATLCPCPAPDETANNTAPVQISIDPPSLEHAFIKGVTQHFTSILAFTLPQDISYGRNTMERLAHDDKVLFKGRCDVAPFQRLDPGELKFTNMDGLANPYLALAAILGGGYAGMESDSKPVPMGGFKEPQQFFPFPSFFSQMVKLSESLDESIEALKKDKVLQGILGEGFVRYITVQRTEQRIVSEMSENDRLRRMVRRY